MSLFPDEDSIRVVKSLDSTITVHFRMKKAKTYFRVTNNLPYFLHLATPVLAIVS